MPRGDPLGVDVLVLAACAAAGATVLRVSGVSVHTLRRFCVRKGVAWEFAMAAACAVLFASGAAAIWHLVARALGLW